VTKLLLVRHAQSAWNAQGRWQGQADPPLSDRGRDEARVAADGLTGFGGSFFASPLLRAKQTAEIISGVHGDGSVLLEPDLREIDVGDFSGLTNDEIEKQFPDAWASLHAGRLETFPSGESREDFRVRVLGALDRLAVRHPAGEFFVVTHGGAIGAIERHLGVHPGVGVKNLEGRRFEIVGGELSVVGDRVGLLDQSS
jgi:probable phosphoglycerate mutase